MLTVFDVRLFEKFVKSEESVELIGLHSDNVLTPDEKDYVVLKNEDKGLTYVIPLTTFLNDYTPDFDENTFDDDEFFYEESDGCEGEIVCDMSPKEHYCGEIVCDLSQKIDTSMTPIPTDRNSTIREQGSQIAIPVKQELQRDSEGRICW
jgi:hypothetical protein